MKFQTEKFELSVTKIPTSFFITFPTLQELQRQEEKKAEKRKEPAPESTELNTREEK